MSAYISLPPPSTSGTMSLEAAIAKRRSVRRYAPQDLTLEQIGQLLWATSKSLLNLFSLTPSGITTFVSMLIAVNLLAPVSSSVS